MELRRTKNVATIITFPILDATTGLPKTGAAALDSEIDTWADGAAPDGFTDCTNEATEIGTTGIYYLSLTQAEMNADYIVVQVNATAALTQVIVINTVHAPTVASITTIDDFLDTEIAAIKAKTDNLPTDPADASDIAALIDALPTAAEVASAVAAPSAATIADAVWDEAGVELSALPTVTSSLRQQIQLLFQDRILKWTQTATQRKRYKSDGSTVYSTETISDDGTTVTKGAAA